MISLLFFYPFWFVLLTGGMLVFAVQSVADGGRLSFLGLLGCMYLFFWVRKIERAYVRSGLEELYRLYSGRILFLIFLFSLAPLLSLLAESIVSGINAEGVIFLLSFFIFNVFSGCMAVFALRRKARADF